MIVWKILWRTNKTTIDAFTDQLDLQITSIKYYKVVPTATKTKRDPADKDETKQNIYWIE